MINGIGKGDGIGRGWIVCLRCLTWWMFGGWMLGSLEEGW